jgi:molybdopterin converting factor subunit 1
MEVHVRYFAAAKDAAGTGAETLTLEPGATVAGLRDALAQRHPRIRSLGAGLRFAVGERFVPADTALLGGETVALIPPVSGG